MTWLSQNTTNSKPFKTSNFSFFQTVNLTGYSTILGQPFLIPASPVVQPRGQGRAVVQSYHAEQSKREAEPGGQSKGVRMGGCSFLFCA